MVSFQEPELHLLFPNEAIIAGSGSEDVGVSFWGPHLTPLQRGVTGQGLMRAPFAGMCWGQGTCRALPASVTASDPQG